MQFSLPESLALILVGLVLLLAGLQRSTFKILGGNISATVWYARVLFVIVGLLCLVLGFFSLLPDGGTTVVQNSDVPTLTPTSRTEADVPERVPTAAPTSPPTLTPNPVSESMSAADYVTRGLAYYEQGQYEQAIADYDRAIDLNPDDARPYNNRGNAYSKQGQYEQAIADYDRAIDLNPDDAPAYYNRGLAYRQQGQHERAIADFERYLELSTDPTFRERAEQILRELGAR